MPNSADKNQLIGVAMGSATAAVAVVGDRGRPQIVHNREGASITPVVVEFLPDGQVEIGAEAKKSLTRPGTYSVGDFSQELDQSWHYEFNGKIYTAIELTTFVLERLISDTEAAIGSVGQVAISVPASSSDAARRAILDAAQAAGLTVQGLIDEPRAIALFYHLSTSTIQPRIGDLVQWESDGNLQFPEPRKITGILDADYVTVEGSNTGLLTSELVVVEHNADVATAGLTNTYDKYAVIDLGKNYLDVSVVERQGSDFELLEHVRAESVNGSAFDKVLLGLARRKFTDLTGAELDPLVFGVREAEDVKITLSKREGAGFLGSNVQSGIGPGLEQKFDIDPDWELEKVRTHIRKEFRTWNERLNSFPAGPQRENAQEMLNDLGRARILLDRDIEQKKVWIEITRAEFEESISSLLVNIKHSSDELIGKVGIAYGNITSVFLAGGSTKVPAVVGCIEAIFDKEAVSTPMVDEVLALGTALSATRSGDVRPITSSSTRLPQTEGTSRTEKTTPKKSETPAGKEESSSLVLDPLGETHWLTADEDTPTVRADPREQGIPTKNKSNPAPSRLPVRKEALKPRSDTRHTTRRSGLNYRVALSVLLILGLVVLSIYLVGQHRLEGPIPKSTTKASSSSSDSGPNVWWCARSDGVTKEEYSACLSSGGKAYAYKSDATSEYWRLKSATKASSSSSDSGPNVWWCARSDGVTKEEYSACLSSGGKAYAYKSDATSEYWRLKSATKASSSSSNEIRWCVYQSGSQLKITKFNEAYCQTIDGTSFSTWALANAEYRRLESSSTYAASDEPNISAGGQEPVWCLKGEELPRRTNGSTCHRLGGVGYTDLRKAVIATSIVIGPAQFGNWTLKSNRASGLYIAETETESNSDAYFGVSFSREESCRRAWVTFAEKTRLNQPSSGGAEGVLKIGMEVIPWRGSVDVVDGMLFATWQFDLGSFLGSLMHGYTLMIQPQRGGFREINVRVSLKGSRAAIVSALRNCLS